MKLKITPFLFCLICSVIFIASVNVGFCATYYVTNSGDDNASGLSNEVAWRTISKVNSYKFADGDTVLFKRGDVFDDATLGSPGVDNFTFADYGTGDKPFFDGDKIRPIQINDTISNLTIRNIDISGQDWLATKGGNVDLDNISGITLDGIVGNGHSNYAGINKAKNAIEIEFCSGTIEIKNCLLYNWGPLDLPETASGTDYNAFHLKSHTSGFLSMHNNVVHDIQSDGFHRQLCKASALMYDNEFYNFGENAYDDKASENIEIYRNHFYRTAGFTGKGGSGGDLYPLIHIHSEGSMPAKNVTISDNLLEDNDNPAINIAGLPGVITENVQVYRNWIKNCTSGVRAFNYLKDIKIYNNTVTSLQGTSGYFLLIHNGGDASGNIEVYNNIFYNGGATMGDGFQIEVAGSLSITRNIVYVNHSNSLLLKLDYGDPLVSNNCWYNHATSGTWIQWKTTTYDASQETKWRDHGHVGSYFLDPVFANPTTGDFTLATDSPLPKEIFSVTGTTRPEVTKSLQPPQNLLITTP